MSIDGWSVSFAKYLELRFYGQLYTRRGFDNSCPHSLHQEHQHYFAQHNVVAAFKYINNMNSYIYIKYKVIIFTISFVVDLQLYNYGKSRCLCIQLVFEKHQKVFPNLLKTLSQWQFWVMEFTQIFLMF